MEFVILHEETLDSSLTRFLALLFSFSFSKSKRTHRIRSFCRMSFHEVVVDVGTEEEEDLSDDDSMIEDDDKPEIGSVEFA